LDSQAKDIVSLEFRASGKHVSYKRRVFCQSAVVYHPSLPYSFLEATLMVRNAQIADNPLRSEVCVCTIVTVLERCVKGIHRGLILFQLLIKSRQEVLIDQLPDRIRSSLNGWCELPAVRDSQHSQDCKLELIDIIDFAPRGKLMFTPEGYCVYGSHRKA